MSVLHKIISTVVFIFEKSVTISSQLNLFLTIYELVLMLHYIFSQDLLALNS